MIAGYLACLRLIALSGLASNKGLSLSPLLLLIIAVSLLLALKAGVGAGHPLERLLALEGLMLTTIWLLARGRLMLPPQFILTFLTLAVAEASLGLGILISLARQSDLPLSRI